ncbi:hypothetical protein [Arenicella xantha]|uniref:Outer membrane protein with beta-barrel domain n=1 Tax=Arenicella xantha TaxID=644221 RepID=A0A395JK78_9GAMM|nr:hypothetical protein [Arenicella xantha]RBP49198.1 hypothetical protein DFR28_104126 [Arenicella xantha]
MKNILLLITTITALSLNVAAHADTPSFTYVGLEYVASGNLDVTDGNTTVNLDLDGFALTGSLELGIFFLQLSRFELESDEILGGNIDDNISSAAFGMTFELPQTQVYGLIRARRDELSLRAGGFEEDEDLGYVGAEAGVRINLTDRFEINAHIGKPVEEGNAYGVGAQFFVTDNVGITLDFRKLEAEDDEIKGSFDTTSLGVRVSF